MGTLLLSSRIRGLVDALTVKVASAIWSHARQRRGHTWLRVDALRMRIVSWRKSYFIDRKDALRTWNGETQNVQAIDATIKHNLGGLHDINGCRGLRVILPLAVIETYKPLSTMPSRGDGFDLDYVSDAKVLDIGPRTEGEIFTLIAYGFAPENVRGLDLISYSPFIDVGDMHRMLYADDQFDITIATCVLVYSHDPRQACAEMIRVTKDRGLVCIAQDTVPNAGEGAIPTLGKALLTSDDYLALFAPHVERVFYRHELPERLKPIEDKQLEGSNYTMSLVFRITKDAAAATARATTLN